MEIIYNKLPFPVFRKVIDYMGFLPKLPDMTLLSLTNHFNDKYCKRCGEYITTRKFVSRKPFHLSCRQKWYTPDHENIKYYHVQYPSMFQVLDGKDNRWRPTMERCPVVLYSKQILNYYQMDICADTTDMEHRGGAWVNYSYHKNEKMLNVFYNDKFCVVPEMFREQFDMKSLRLVLLQLSSILSGGTKMDFIKRFQVQSKDKILEWILHLSPTALNNINIYRFETMRKFLRTISSHDLRYRAILSIGLHRIAERHPRWFQQILFEYPFVLDRLDEKAIQRFFKRNRDWFLRYVKLRPDALQYVSLVYNGRHHK